MFKRVTPMQVTNIKGIFHHLYLHQNWRRLNAKKFRKFNKKINNLNVKPNSTILNEVGGPESNCDY